jgi:hypothetical protein
MSNEIKTFTISEIAKWNLQNKVPGNSKKTDKVQLPDIQRGFVWRPDRIEDLWDSLFRGFPIGSFLISEIKPNEYDLLDGQQRATSIGIGLYNPWLDSTPKKPANPLLWIDISREKSGPYKHNFKIITSSHPWGFTSQKTPLDEESRRKALLAFAENNCASEIVKYYEFDLKKCWPWSSTLPIPFCFLTEALQVGESLKEQGEYLIGIIKERLSHVKRNENKKIVYLRSVLEFLNSSDFEELMAKTKNILTAEIPAIKLDSNLLNSPTGDKNTNLFSLPIEGEESDWLSEEEKFSNKDTIEEIFERINSKGFPLEGEELIYSIFKSQCPEAKGIPELCHYIRPSKLVSLCIKIIMSQSKETVPNRIEISAFKNWIRKSENAKKLTHLLSSLKSKDNIFSTAENLLFGTEKFQFSYYQLNQFAENDQDAFWILLARLHKGDQIEINSKLHRKVIGFLTALAWFGKQSHRQVTLPALSIIRKDVQTQNSAELFWSSDTLSKAIKAKKERNGIVFALTPIPPPSYLKNVFNSIYEIREEWWEVDISDVVKPQSNLAQFVKKHFDSSNNEDFYNEEEKNDRWVFAIDSFITKLRESDSILTYALGDTIKGWFDDFYLNKVDLTQRPWDIDHIYATKLLNKRNIKNTKILKSWQDTIGNKRYWPMELNRGAGGLSPGKKLSFDLESSDRSLFLHFCIKSEAEIFEKSLVDERWKDIWRDFDKKKEASNLADEVLRLILDRIIQIYSFWYDELLISELFPIKV